MEVIPITDPRAEASERPVVIVSVRTGQLKEIPCGPRDVVYVSGDRLVVWNKNQSKPEIPRRHAATWRLYSEFCADREIAKRHNLNLDQSKAYYSAYLRFMEVRGLGAKAKHLHGVTQQEIEELWHPECLVLRAASKDSHRQLRMGSEALTGITAGLHRPNKLEQSLAAVEAELEAKRGPSKGGGK